MAELRFVEALRYSIPGGVFLLMAAWSYPRLAEIVEKGGAFQTAFFAAASSVLVGTMLQLVHRAATYPVTFRLLLVWTLEGRRPRWADVRSCYTPSDPELRVANARWRFTSRPENGGVASRLEEWAAQVHFLYAASWAVLLALAIPPLAGYTPSWRRAVLAGVGFVILLVAAVVHDRRLMLHERRVVGV